MERARRKWGRVDQRSLQCRPRFSAAATKARSSFLHNEFPLQVSAMRKEGVVAIILKILTCGYITLNVPFYVKVYSAG